MIDGLGHLRRLLEWLLLHDRLHWRWIQRCSRVERRKELLTLLLLLQDVLLELL